MGIDLGFRWESVALFIGSMCAISAESGLKAAFYNSAIKIGIIGALVIIGVGLIVLNTADHIQITIGGVSLDAQEWLILGGLIFFILTPKSLTE